MEKGFLQSQTIIGAIQSIVPLVVVMCSIFGLEIRDIEDVLTQTLVSLATAVFGVLGLFNVIVGRLKAKQPIDVGKAYIKQD